MASVLSCEEGQPGQQVDRIESFTPEAMLVVGFKPRSKAAIRKWKLETRASSDEAGACVTWTGDADSGDPEEGAKVEALPDPIAVRNEQKPGFETVGGERVATATARLQTELRLELELVAEEISQAEYLSRERKQSAARATNSERKPGVNSHLEWARAVSL